MEAIAAACKPSDAEIEAFYHAHPQLFGRRRIYSLMQTRIRTGRERCAELADVLAGALADGGSPGAFFDWLMDHGIVYTSAQEVVPAEDVPADLLAALQHAARGAAYLVDTGSGPMMLQVADIEEQPVTLAQSRAPIAEFLRKQGVAGTLTPPDRGA